MIIIKIGGSAISDKTKVAKPRLDRIRNIARVIAEAARKIPSKLIVVHGGGSFGHPYVIRYGIDSGVHTRTQWKGFSKTRESVLSLSFLLSKEFEKNGMKMAVISPFYFIIQKNKKILRFDKSTIALAHKRGFTPLLHGDMVFDLKLGGSVCSGDAIVSYLGKDAEKIIFIIDVDGVLDNEGKTIRRIVSADLKKVKGFFWDAGGYDVTGGIRKKLEEIMKIGKPAYIVGADNLKGIENLILGREEKKCTIIEARNR
ncbi:MAG: isopentenyl phosphate kinase [Candidatus Anstonellales archaeon]